MYVSFLLKKFLYGNLHKIDKKKIDKNDLREDLRTKKIEKEKNEEKENCG